MQREQLGPQRAQLGVARAAPDWRPRARRAGAPRARDRPSGSPARACRRATSRTSSRRWLSSATSSPSIAEICSRAACTAGSLPWSLTGRQGRASRAASVLRRRRRPGQCRCTGNESPCPASCCRRARRRARVPGRAGRAAGSRAGSRCASANSAAVSSAVPIGPQRRRKPAVSRPRKKQLLDQRPDERRCATTASAAPTSDARPGGRAESGASPCWRAACRIGSSERADDERRDHRHEREAERSAAMTAARTRPSARRASPVCAAPPRARRRPTCSTSRSPAASETGE